MKYKDKKHQILSNIKIDSVGCWIWQHQLNKWGYGRPTTVINGKKQPIMAHRLSLLAFKNTSVKDGFCVDHLCRKPACVNPDHLEIVTMAENNLRNPNWAGHIKNCKKCNGPLSKRSSGGAICLPCTRKYWKEYNDRRSKKKNGMVNCGL